MTKPSRRAFTKLIKGNNPCEVGSHGVQTGMAGEEGPGREGVGGRGAPKPTLCLLKWHQR